MSRTITEKLKAAGLGRVLMYLDKDYERNIPKIADWLIRMDPEKKSVGSQAQAVKDALADKNNNWSRLVRTLYTDIDAGVRRRLFENFVINASLIGTPRQRKNSEKYGCNVPWAILMDPTSACNLKCVGCWASEYGDRLNLSFEELDNIVRQGKELGTYFYLFSGGEPLVRKKDIIRLCEKHSDCAFLAFTNGTLIDEQFADDMLRVQNFVPAISIEGFEEATDARRGNGTYQHVIDAMDLLKSKRLPFGISLCYTRANTEVIGSDDYIDYMIDKGALFAWLFTYMPVGVDAVPDLMVTAEQREFMYHKIRGWRSTKPVFTMDFWNDGEYAGGCIAGGRSYMHINAGGDIEPCAFIHYSDSNIRTHTLLEAYQRPLFMAYYHNQPFNDNMLRPCPLLDNPPELARMVDSSGAKSTDIKDPEDVHELCAKCGKTAEKWAVTADKLWNGNPRHQGKQRPTGKQREAEKRKEEKDKAHA